MARRVTLGLALALILSAALGLWNPGATREDLSQNTPADAAPSHVRAEGVAVPSDGAEPPHDTVDWHVGPIDHWSMLYVFMLATFIGLGVIGRVSRLLHTPLMSLTNAISAIAVVGAIIVAGSDYPKNIRILGAIAVFASTTNIVSGFLITDRMLKMFKQPTKGGEKR